MSYFLIIDLSSLLYIPVFVEEEFMNLFLVTFQSVIVLLGIGALGFFVIQRKIIPKQALAVLTPLSLEIALPCLVFANIMTTFSPESTPEWWMLPLWWLLFTGFAFVFTVLTSFFSAKKTRREFMVSLFYQNALFFPLAILSGMFGGSSEYLTLLFILTLFFPSFLFNTYSFFFGRKVKEINWKKIFHPVFVATLLALGLRLTNLHVLIPDFVVSICALVGAMTVPLVMLVLGGNLYLDYQKKEKVQFGEIVKFVAMKNFLLPLLFFGVLLLFRPSYSIALLLMLQSVVPPVTAVPLLVDRVGGNHAVANQFLFASFVCSLISIPLLIGVFGLLF